MRKSKSPTVPASLSRLEQLIEEIKQRLGSMGFHSRTRKQPS